MKSKIPRDLSSLCLRTQLLASETPIISGSSGESPRHGSAHSRREGGAGWLGVRTDSGCLGLGDREKGCMDRRVRSKMGGWVDGWMNR